MHTCVRPMVHVFMYMYLYRCITERKRERERERERERYIDVYICTYHYFLTYHMMYRAVCCGCQAGVATTVFAQKTKTPGLKRACLPVIPPGDAQGAACTSHIGATITLLHITHWCGNCWAQRTAPPPAETPRSRPPFSGGKCQRYST